MFRIITILWKNVSSGISLGCKLASAGFTQIEMEPTRIYRVEDAREFLAAKDIDADALAPHVDGKFMSAFVRAVKPQKSPCCGPACCN